MNIGFNNPWWNLGVGILSQPTLGSGLLSGTQAAQQATQGDLTNQLMQQRLQENARRVAISQQVGSLMNPDLKPPSLLQRPDLQQYKQGKLTGLLSEYDPMSAAGLLNPQEKMPEGTVGQYLNAIKYGLIDPTMTDLTAFSQMLKGPQTVVNVGENKIIGSDAPSWVNAQGKHPLATSTISEAVAQGYSPVSNDEMKSRQAGAESAPLVSELASLAFGSGGQKSIFPSDNDSLVSRLKMRGETAYGVGTQSPDYTRQMLYSRTKQAFVTQLARLSGQVGTLTDRDVELVAGMLPQEGFTPEGTAKEQFRQITNFLLSKGVPESQLKSLGLPSWAFRKPLSEFDR